MRKRWRSYEDEHAMTIGDRAFGFLGPVSSSFTLAWLASHRGRLHSMFVGGKRLSIYVCWDSQGSRALEHDDDEVDAIRLLTYGSDDIRGKPAREERAVVQDLVDHDSVRLPDRPPIYANPARETKPDGWGPDKTRICQCGHTYGCTCGKCEACKQEESA